MALETARGKALPARKHPAPDPVVQSSTAPTDAWQATAESISRNIQERHLPFGTLADPMFVAPDSNEIAIYTRSGDSAIWTGHYLAAEAFRHKVCGASEALENVKKALDGLCSLIDVTGTDLMARTLVPVESRFAAAIEHEEESNGIFRGSRGGKNCVWVGDTSRDQYSGVLFGLVVAYDMVDDPDVRAEAARLITRNLDFILDHHWAIVMPDGKIATLFIGRPEQQLAFLQIGRHVNPEKFESRYRKHRPALAPLTGVPIAYETLDPHGSYFKFNLAMINLFNLIRLEEDGRFKKRYLKAYDILHRAVAKHGNAHFNMIDRALKGQDASRDRETVDLLASWLKRPRRDEFVDLRGQLESCGQPDRACEVIPVEARVRTDFLWQRSPFLLVGGGKGLIEGAGIDFILPFWMARFYGVL